MSYSAVYFNFPAVACVLTSKYVWLPVRTQAMARIYKNYSNLNSNNLELETRNNMNY
jgi:hypothetical protein